MCFEFGTATGFLDVHLLCDVRYDVIKTLRL